MTLWMPHFQKFPKSAPMVMHSESRTMAAAILFSAIYDHPIHIAHVSLKEEILLIKVAKEKGLKVTCVVCPHHLFLTKDRTGFENLSGLPGRGEVRPRLATQEDVDSLWTNLDVVDCFATDHAPHTAAEKDGENPPPGFPGLETMLPLLLTAVTDGRLTINQLLETPTPNAFSICPNNQRHGWKWTNPRHMRSKPVINLHAAAGLPLKVGK
jgi:carbamoyl-phosphate synthase/aspartate carbamoyltransferase/dihydroorotase